MTQPLDLDAIEAVIRNAAALGADITPETAAAMADEIRRLRAQVAAVTALCDEQDMAARLFEFPTPEWIVAVRRAIEDAAAVPAAEEAHVVADDSDDPDPSTRPWLVQKICCGRDDGTAEFASWEEADRFREEYIDSARIASHERTAIVRAAAGEAQQDGGPHVCSGCWYVPCTSCAADRP